MINFKWLIGLAILVVAGFSIASLKLGDNIGYFVTPDEAQAKVRELTDKTINLGGMVKAGTVSYQAETQDLSFVVWDMKGHEIRVAYKGTPPDMFKENAGVVVEGRLLSADSIQAQRLIVKHSEEYKKPDTKHSVDKDLLKESIFK